LVLNTVPLEIPDLDVLAALEVFLCITLPLLMILFGYATGVVGGLS
jgi:hypothetical protein